MGKRRNVHQSVLMNADIHKRPEIGDVGNRPLQNHARLKITQGFHTFFKGCRTEFRTRIPARLLKLCENIPDGRQTELICYIILGIQTTQKRRITDNPVDFTAVLCCDALYHTVGLRMHR